QGRPNPDPVAALFSSAVVNCCDRPAIALAQDSTKSAANVALMSVLTWGTLRKLRPPTELPGVHGIGVFTATPLASSASPDTTVKTAPGGYRPASGSIDGVPGALWLATARIRPLEGWRGTVPAEPGAAAAARQAA